MIPTIQSRCQTFHFRKLQLPEIIQRLEQILKQEGLSSEKEALNLIALSASGSIRDAESLLDEVISFSGAEKEIKAETVRVLLGAADKPSIFQFLELLEAKKTKEAVNLINDLILDGTDIKEFTNSSIQYLRQMLLYQIDSESQTPLSLSLTKEERGKLQDLGRSFPEKELKEMIEKFMQAQAKMRYSAIIQLPLELAVIDVCLKDK